GLIDDIAEQTRSRRAALRAAEYQPRTLVGFELREVAHRHAAIFGERHGRLCRRTLRIESILQRRAAALHLPVRLMVRQFLHAHGEPPRRREAMSLAVRNAG